MYSAHQIFYYYFCSTIERKTYAGRFGLILGFAGGISWVSLLKEKYLTTPWKSLSHVYRYQVIIGASMLVIFQTAFCGHISSFAAEIWNQDVDLETTESFSYSMKQQHTKFAF